MAATNSVEVDRLLLTLDIIVSRIERDLDLSDAMPSATQRRALFSMGLQFGLELAKTYPETAARVLAQIRTFAPPAPSDALVMVVEAVP